MWPLGAIGESGGRILGSLMDVCGVVRPPDGGVVSPKVASTRNLGGPEVVFDM